MPTVNAKTSHSSYPNCFWDREAGKEPKGGRPAVGCFHSEMGWVLCEVLYDV